MSKVQHVDVVSKHRTAEQTLPEEVAISLAEIATDAKRGLLALSVDVGLQVLKAMMAEEVTTIVGAKGKHNAERTATRHGSDHGHVVLGGRRVAIVRPRARTMDDREVELQTYEVFQDPELLSEMTFERMVAGLSTRRYEVGLEPVGKVERRATSKAAVSRRFVAKTSTALRDLMGADLSQSRFVVLFLDGIEVAEHTCVVALGVDDQGHKHPLALRQGTTENAGLCRSLLSGLVERGLCFDDGILVVIDGGKGLRKAVRQVFGSLAAVQRCQIHKRRNVLDHLPQHLRTTVGKQLDRAWRSEDVARARRSLEALAANLETEHPSAAASIREGLEETLTVNALGLPSSLRRSLRSTNAIESMNSVARQVTRNVKRWRDGKMVERWTAAGMVVAKRQFRRVNGCRDMHVLIAALKRHTQGMSVQEAMLQESA